MNIVPFLSSFIPLDYIRSILNIQKQSSLLALSNMATQVQPIYLISVNKIPEVAKKLVAELIDVSSTVLGP